MIRQLDQSDAEIYRVIRLEGLRCEPTAFTVSYRDWVARPLADFATRLGEAAVFAAFDGLNIIGVVALEPDNHNPDIGWIGEVFVLPSFRRQSIAGNLIKYGIAAAETRYGELRLEVGASNNPARDLYARNGFRQIDQTPQALATKTGSVCEILMSRTRQ